VSKCGHCGAALAKDGRGRIKQFCNRSCASSSRERDARANKQRQCRTCGTTFYRAYGAKRRSQQRYCSRACTHVAARRGNSPEAVLNGRISRAACSLLARALRHKGVRKTAKLVEALGFTPAQLRAHLEARFQSGMTWANYGRNGWHIDHRKPIVTFPRTAGIREINALSNLRPLWEAENCGRPACG
jgi:hypothetical protein